MKQIERVQTGVRIERRLVKVLKGLAEHLDMSLGDLLEGIVLHAFEGNAPFGPDTLRQIGRLKQVYDLDLTACEFASPDRGRRPRGAEDMTPRQTLFGFRLIYVLFIAVASFQTARAGFRGEGGGYAPVHLALLGSAEVAGAVLFLWRRTQLGAAILLLIVYAIATVLTLLDGGNPLRFLYFAATALFIVHADRALHRPNGGTPPLPAD